MASPGESLGPAGFTSAAGPGRPGVPSHLLSVHQLSVSFPSPSGPLTVVRDVAFSVGRGETLGLVGESGSGKSLTALALVGLVPPPGRITAGRVLLEGRDLLQLTEDELRAVRGAGIGVVFQEPASALSPVFTIGDQVAEALVAHGRATWPDARTRAVQLLDAVQIPEPGLRARDYPHELSGGLRQRAMIAIAIACDPPVLVADEPTTALDVTVQAEVLDLLGEIQSRRALGLLLISHDLGVIAGRAHRVAVMYAGRIVEQGPVADIFDAPRHPYTEALLAAAPGRSRVAGRLPVIDGTVPAPDAMPRGCAFEPRCRARLPVCGTAPPAVVAIGEAHEVACYLHGSPAEGGASAAR